MNGKVSIRKANFGINGQDGSGCQDTSQNGKGTGQDMFDKQRVPRIDMAALSGRISIDSIE